MKIKLIRHPYGDYEVGEVVDLGEEKNKSMVSIGRAVWVEEEVKKKPARGPDGKFISVKETEEPKKKEASG